MALAHALSLPLGEVARLKRRVVALAENRPAVYRMLDTTGRVLYVGKAKHLRTRLLSYFRAQYPETTDAYSWWTVRSNARERNVGWRLDYFFVSQSFWPHVVDAAIHPEVHGSDHCPISLVIRNP